ncbi:MAG: TonB-dependent receptor [Candidatus Omnitrophota bacterium]|nr:TonB-dependent receptor [Candidatus Omnitrophota bacterium]
MKRICVLVSIFCSFVLPQLSLAQSLDLEKIVVTPSRIEEEAEDISRKVDIITAYDIKSSGAKDVSEVLGNLASVNISNYGGLGATKSIRMRGSSAAQVLVMIDGRPINNPRDGQAELSDIPLENIERIEVVRGPCSSLYGSGAMGGAVNIITKSPSSEKQETEFTTSFGSFRTYIERLSHGGRISNLGYTVNAGYQSSEGFRDNSEYNAKDFSSKIEYNLNNTNKLGFNAGFQRSKLGTPGGLTSFDADDKQRILKNFLDINWNFKPDETFGLLARGYHNYDRLEFMENTAGSSWDTALSKDIHTTKVMGYEFQANKQLCEAYQLIAGFNYSGNLNDSTSSAKHEYTMRAVYLENRLDLFNCMEVNFGARVDDYSNFGTELNPSLSILYKINEDLKLHSSISRSFRAPTFNDLYWPNNGWSAGNPNLTPEKGITGEAGIDFKLNKYMTCAISYYRSSYNQLINWVETSPWFWEPKNISSAIIDGLEIENKLYLVKNLDLELGYAFMRAKDDKNDTYLVYQPKHRANSTLRWRLPKGFTFEMRGQFTNRSFLNSNNTNYVKRFFVLDFNVSKKINSCADYFLTVNNLLDKKYQVMNDYPMPGLSVTSGLRLDF